MAEMLSSSFCFPAALLPERLLPPAFYGMGRIEFAIPRLYNGSNWKSGRGWVRRAGDGPGPISGEGSGPRGIPKSCGQIEKEV